MHDTLRLEQLRKKLDLVYDDYYHLSRLKVLENKLNEIIESGKPGKIHTESWEERQFLYISTAKIGWFGRKLMENVQLSDRTCACKKCHLRYEIPDDVVEVCCELHDGICPKCKTCKYLNASSEMLLFDGHVEISPEKLKLGRAARRRRNKWRKGEISAESAGSF